MDDSMTKLRPANTMKPKKIDSILLTLGIMLTLSATALHAQIPKAEPITVEASPTPTTTPTPTPTPDPTPTTVPTPIPFSESASNELLENALQGKFEDLHKQINTNRADPNFSTKEKISQTVLKSYPDIPDSIKNLVGSDTEITPLMAAAAYGNTEACKILIELGAERWKKTKRWKTNATWLAGKGKHTETIRTLLLIEKDSPARKIEVFINRNTQTGELYEDGDLTLKFEVSTGKKGYETRTGKYIVTEKDRNHVSSIYHSPMNYFLRCSFEDFGLHEGNLPGYPASHGCIRTSRKTAKILFSKVLTGSTVTIQ